jgi:[acyl-carrier-protein] S-malonyltransferase
MKTVFLFPGQGSQYVGMGREFYELYPEARAVFEEADAALGWSVTGLCFEGPAERLAETEYCQPAVLTASIACLAVLRRHGLEPDAAAGHSLGEYAALVAAGALAFRDAVVLVHRRGRYMQEAVPLGKGGMVAVLGLAKEKVEEVCRAAAARGVVEPVNYNSPGQIVIAGENAALEEASRLALAAGARKCVRLNVSAPFHSSLMAPAARALRADLDRTEIRDPQIPVVANIHADYVRTADEVRKALGLQVAGPVRWEESVRRLIADGATTFVEVGPGRVLTGLLRQMARDVAALHVEDPSSLEKVLAVVGGGWLK